LSKKERRREERERERGRERYTDKAAAGRERQIERINNKKEKERGTAR
jgi:hypothetical protein